MSAEQLFARFNPFRKSSSNRLKIVYGNLEFRDLIKRQRALADRGSHGFSLTVFNVAEDVKVDEQQIISFAEIVRSRARFTDAVGQLGKTQLGVLLPETSFSGAQEFADEIQRVVLKKALRPPGCRVFSYPSDGNQDLQSGSPGQPSLPDFLSPEDGPPFMDKAPGTVRPNAGPDSQCAFDASHGGSLPQGFEAFLAPPLPKWKRAIDVIGAFMGLILLSPIFLLVAVLIKVVSPGPVFFHQDRVGYLGRHFRMWKFRTMQVDGDGDLHRQHIIGLIRDEKPLTKLDQGVDMRIIPFGKLLRVTCVDELPQLINILRGEMSLIGPRPDVPYSVDQYLPWNKQRFDAVPGLTGLWQVSGKNRTTHSEMMRLDIKYAHNSSFWFDLKIFVRTIPMIFSLLKDHLSRPKSPETPKSLESPPHNVSHNNLGNS